jgi:hypothetical protein
MVIQMASKVPVFSLFLSIFFFLVGGDGDGEQGTSVFLSRRVHGSTQRASFCCSRCVCVRALCMVCVCARARMRTHAYTQTHTPYTARIRLCFKTMSVKGEYRLMKLMKQNKGWRSLECLFT